MACKNYVMRVLFIYVVLGVAIVNATCVDESNNLTTAQCATWQTMFDRLQGNTWIYCNRNRNNPCACPLIQCNKRNMVYMRGYLKKLARMLANV